MDNRILCYKTYDQIIFACDFSLSGKCHVAECFTTTIFSLFRNFAV